MIAMRDVRLQRDPGTSPTSLVPDLRPEGSELVYIPLIWIDINVSTTLLMSWSWVIFHASLTCLPQLTVYWQWNNSPCLQHVLQVCITSPVAGFKSCLHSLHTTPCNGDMLTISRLLMGGTLSREHNISGRAIFVLQPGLIGDDKLVSDVDMKFPS